MAETIETNTVNVTRNMDEVTISRLNNGYMLRYVSISAMDAYDWKYNHKAIRPKQELVFTSIEDLFKWLTDNFNLNQFTASMEVTINEPG